MAAKLLQNNKNIEGSTVTCIYTRAKKSIVFILRSKCTCAISTSVFSHSKQKQNRKCLKLLVAIRRGNQEPYFQISKACLNFHKETCLSKWRLQLLSSCQEHLSMVRVFVVTADIWEHKDITSTRTQVLYTLKKQKCLYKTLKYLY